MRWVHMKCLCTWLAHSPRRAAFCEVCRQPYLEDMVAAALPLSDGTPESEASLLVWQYEASDAVRELCLTREKEAKRRALQERIRGRKVRGAAPG